MALSAEAKAFGLRKGDGVGARHAWIWISEAGMQVEDLGEGTLVNGYQITERVQVSISEVELYHVIFSKGSDGKKDA